MNPPAKQTYTQTQEMPCACHKPRCRKCCACHEQAISKVLRLSRKTGPSAARSTTASPLDSYQMLPMPRKRTPRCRKCCACHEICEPSPKCCPCHARSTTSSPFRHLPNAAHATQTYTQMQEMLRMPRNLQAISKVLRLSRKTGPSAARSTTSLLDTYQTLHLPRKRTPRSRKFCACHEIFKVLRLSRKTGPSVSRALDNIQ